MLPVIKQTIFSEILYLNRCIGSKVMAFLLNGWILPFGGVALGMVCPAASAAGLLFDDLFLNRSRTDKIKFKGHAGLVQKLQQYKMVHPKWVDFA